MQCHTALIRLAVIFGAFGSAMMGGLAASANSTARQYRLSPIDLGSGFAIEGTITTNGKVGAVGASDIVNWNLTITETSQVTFSPLNSHDVSFQLFVDAGVLKMPTSPDGMSDGGCLKVYGNSRHFAALADCTGAFTDGGQSYYSYGADFGFLQLGLPNQSIHTLGTLHTGSQFDLIPVDYGDGTTMAGTVTTNLQSGSVHLVDWSIVVRHQSSKSFTPANSRVIEATAVYAAQKSLRVRPDDDFASQGRLVIGIAGLDPTLVILADFSIQSPQAVAGYVDPFIYQISDPLQLDAFGDRLVGRVIPVPIAAAR